MNKKRQDILAPLEQENTGKEFMHSVGLQFLDFPLGEQEDPEDQSVEQKKLQSRNISVKEGAACSVMEGCGNRYITPYGLAIGANTTEIALLSSFPPVVGSFFQLWTLKLMEKYSRKRIVFLATILQACMWLVLLGLGVLTFLYGLQGHASALLLILIYTVLFALSSSIAPAWTSWMRDLVPNKCGSYFGYRNRVAGIVLLMSMLSAGFALDYFKGTKIFLGFVILFSLAFLFRTISALLFLRQFEPKLILPHQRVHFKEMLRILNKDDFGKFIIFQTLISFAVAIASPFLAVYLLKDLNFSYTSFIIVVMTAPATKLIFMPLWGKFADRYGNKKVIKITGLIIWTVPVLWLLTIFFKTTHPEVVLPYLVFVEAITNFGWAGFELASANFIFDGVSRENIPLYNAFFNIFTNVGTFIGALIGGLLAMGTISVLGLSGILLVFLISGMFRLLVYILCIHTIKETRNVEEFDIEEARSIINHMSLQQIIRLLR